MRGRDGAEVSQRGGGLNPFSSTGKSLVPVGKAPSAGSASRQAAARRSEERGRACRPHADGFNEAERTRHLLFGDTVQTARMIIDTGKAATVHISDVTNTLLSETIGGYITKPRGEIQLKTAGTMFTYWLLGKKVKGIDDKTETKSHSSGTESASDKKSVKSKN